MAKKYFDKLSSLLAEIDLEKEVTQSIEIKHFFSGAALYSNHRICASWTPVGLAFKLSEEEVNKLITNGLAKPLQYFPNGYIKNDYALFDNPGENNPAHWKHYFLKAVILTLNS